MARRDYFAAGLDNYKLAYGDARFFQVFGNLLEFLIVSVPLGIAFVVLLALLLDMRPGRFSSALRLLYFIPGAVTGPALVLLVICILDPEHQPVRSDLQLPRRNELRRPGLSGKPALRLHDHGLLLRRGNVDRDPARRTPGHLPEVLEAAELDGCNAWQKALYIKLPFMRPYIVYQTILIFALNVQLFVEPQLLTSTWVQANVPPQWAPNQLAYSYAFDVGNFGAAAALSLLMLVIGLAGAYVLIRWTGFFKLEGQS